MVLAGSPVKNPRHKIFIRFQIFSAHRTNPADIRLRIGKTVGAAEYMANPVVTSGEHRGLYLPPRSQNNSAHRTGSRSPRLPDLFQFLFGRLSGRRKKQGKAENKKPYGYKDKKQQIKRRKKHFQNPFRGILPEVFSFENRILHFTCSAPFFKLLCLMWQSCTLLRHR